MCETSKLPREEGSRTLTGLKRRKQSETGEGAKKFEDGSVAESHILCPAWYWRQHQTITEDANEREVAEREDIICIYPCRRKGRKYIISTLLCYNIDPPYLEKKTKTDSFFLRSDKNWPLRQKLTRSELLTRSDCMTPPFWHHLLLYELPMYL